MKEEGRPPPPFSFPFNHGRSTWPGKVLDKTLKESVGQPGWKPFPSGCVLDKLDLSGRSLPRPPLSKTQVLLPGGHPVGEGEEGRGNFRPKTKHGTRRNL